MGIGVGIGAGLDDMKARPGAAVASHIITASAGANVTIDPAGDVSVSYGGNQTFTLTPASGYDSWVSVDGGSATKAASYTFTDVTADHAVVASAVAIASERTAIGVGNGTDTDPCVLNAGALAAGDLIIIGIRMKNSGAEVWGFIVTVDAVLVGGNGPGQYILDNYHTAGVVLWMIAYRAASAQSGRVVVTWNTEDQSVGGDVWAQKFTNIGSSTPHGTPQSAVGSSGTTYSTTAQTTAVKTVQIGFVSKNSESTGTWGTGWTNGQGVTGKWSEGFKVNAEPASNQQTLKSSGGSEAWGALWAAFPVRTS